MTFSLAGRCARTGMMGCAVTTSSIAVGSRCSYARPGIGAALTQHRTDPRLGPLALELLARGYDAKTALAGVIAVAPHRDWRQIAIIDRCGRTASFTGEHVDRTKSGEAHGRDCVAIANIVRSVEVPAAMARSFEADPDRPLAQRLVEALAAGEAEGGEFKPVASAALLVAHRESFAYADLRVDDHPRPIDELRRLWRAYEPEADLYVLRASEPAFAPPPASSAKSA
ncbi:Uncharacterized conserved protein, Ntn-hydrolase superfamily [Rhizobiales bacterium GAS113]|nr:Uncharacterized conserved protein, Ntn-hydrolase superfamily [Rhizobiales bacterium GAS113]